MEKKKRQQELEFVRMDLLEKNYMNFDMQYHDYIGEQTAFVLQEWERFEEFIHQYFVLWVPVRVMCCTMGGNSSPNICILKVASHDITYSILSECWLK